MLATRKTTSPSTARRERIYAIGDIHGCYDQLRQLLDQIGEHEATLRPNRPPRLIILGDMIDRGPDSARVLRFLQQLQTRTPNLTVLAGNHEDLLLEVLDGHISAQQMWLHHGGLETLHSLGVRPNATGEHPWALAERLHDALSTDIVNWLRMLPTSYISGDYFFCHAGIKPGVSVKRQSRRDLLWVREEFLEYTALHNFAIVHGHSRTFEAEIRNNRINIDTGAYATGRLSGLYLDGIYRKVFLT